MRSSLREAIPIGRHQEGLVERVLCLILWALLVPCVFASRLGAQQPPPDSFEHVTQLITKGELARAERMLGDFLKRSPQDPRWLELMGVVLDGEGRFPEAEENYLKALRFSPHSASILNNLGNHFMRRGLPEKARGAYQKALSIDPRIANANLHLAALYVEDGEGRKALQCLDRLPKAESEGASALILRAQAVFQSGGGRSDAEAILDRVESAPGMDAGTAFSAGMVYAKLQAYGKAEAFFTRALEQAPGSEEVLYNLGLAAFHAEDLARARQALEALMKRRPDDSDGMLALARVYLKQGQASQAVILLHEAEKLAPDRPDAFTLQAQAASALGFFGDSVTAYDKYLRLRPDADWARRERAFALSRTGKWALGLEDLRRYVADHPNDAIGLYEGGMAEAILDSKKGLEQLLRAVAADPNFLAAHLACGALYYQMGQYEKAIQELDFVVRRDPENSAALDLLGSVYEALHRFEEARDFMAKAFNLAPHNPAVLSHYSHLLFRMGEKEQATRIDAMLRELPPYERGKRPYQGLFDYLSMPESQQRKQYLENLQRSVNVNPRSVPLRVLLGKELLREGKSVQALQVLDPIPDLSSDPRILTECGEALLAADQYSPARKFLQAAVGRDPSFLSAHLGLGVVLLNLEGPGEALKKLDEIRPQDRTSDYYLLRAQILDAKDDGQGASDALDAAYRLSPRRPDVYLQAAGFLIKHQHYQQALDALDVGGRFLPDHPQIMLTRAITLELLSRTPEAGRLLDEIRSRWPEWYEPYLTQGIILETVRRSSASKPLLESAVALGAREAVAYYYLAMATLHATPDDLESAQQAINQALSLSPADPYILTLAGKIALQKKDYPEAIQFLTKALQVWPDMVSARQNLMVTYQAMGDQDKAREESQAIVRIKRENPLASEELPPLPVSGLFGVALPHHGAGTDPPDHP